MIVSSVTGNNVKPVAVIDVGSNSIRLVVYDGLSRTPIPIFNEKVLCGLGKGLAETGQLSQSGTVEALKALPRFVALARNMGALDIHILATAAVREASNGPDFLTRVQDSCGVEVRVISGEEEARLSQLGVLSGAPEASGFMGDLGGGSVELVDLEGGEKATRRVTLPLGPLRNWELIRHNPGELPPFIDRHLQSVSWLKQMQDKPFHVVGGAWRSIARLYMSHVDYPLHVIHHYQVPTGDLLDFCRLISNLSPETLAKSDGISSRRLATIPYAAQLMVSILEVTRPSELVFSANGLREGCLFDLLSSEERAEDPLLSLCKRAPRISLPGSVDGQTMSDWIAPAFADGDPSEERLRLAASLLSDIARMDHPDYRADQAVTRVLRFPFSGVDHWERCFLAQAVAARYGNTLGAARSIRAIKQLLDKGQRKRAQAIGRAIRLGVVLSGGMAPTLKDFSLTRDADGLLLGYRAEAELMLGQTIERRLSMVAEALGCDWRIEPMA